MEFSTIQNLEYLHTSLLSNYLDVWLYLYPVNCKVRVLLCSFTVMCQSSLYSSCTDINECEQKPTPCEYTCQNTEGSFSCSCKAGYSLHSDGVSCVDLDECATGQHVCQHQCVNTQGSYRCACPAGYNQVGDHCLGECVLLGD